jgi:hypothetical protein
MYRDWREQKKGSTKTKSAKKTPISIIKSKKLKKSKLNREKHL